MPLARRDLFHGGQGRDGEWKAQGSRRCGGIGMIRRDGLVSTLKRSIGPPRPHLSRCGQGQAVPISGRHGLNGGTRVGWQQSFNEDRLRRQCETLRGTAACRRRSWHTQLSKVSSSPRQDGLPSLHSCEAKMAPGRHLHTGQWQGYLHVRPRRVQETVQHAGLVNLAGGCDNHGGLGRRCHRNRNR